MNRAPDGTKVILMPSSSPAVPAAKSRPRTAGDLFVVAEMAKAATFRRQYGAAPTRAGLREAQRLRLELDLLALESNL